jgi:hypothetical protein
MIIAVLVAATCISTAAVHAEDSSNLWYWGTIKGEPFSDVEGMEQFQNGSLFGENSLMYLQTILRDDEKSYRIYSVHPFENAIGFVLRDDLNVQDTIPQLLEILDEYYPGLKDNYDSEASLAVVPTPPSPFDHTNAEYVFSYSEDRMFYLTDRRAEAFPEDTVNQIRKSLASKGLISEYYAPGQTANYEVQHPFADNMLTYLSYDYLQNPAVLIDRTPIQAYLSEHYPDCEIAAVGVENHFQIVSKKEMTFREQLNLALELYQNVGISPEFVVKASDSENLMIGHNAMELLGDTNLDCEVDILDVIAANKNILGIIALDKTGLKNADMNGNGKMESDDSLDILKEVIA